MNTKQILIAIILSIFTASCRKDIKKAKQTADNFYALRSQNKYFQAAKLENPIITKTDYQSFEKTLKKIDKKNGKIIYYDATSIKATTINKQTIYKLSYRIFHTKKIMIDSLYLIKQGKKYKIIFYKWREKE
jgi:hypothetical protein